MCLDVSYVSSIQTDMEVDGNTVDATIRHEDSKRQIKVLCGGSLTDFPPIFDNNGQSMYVVWNNRVRIYSTETGELIQDMDDNRNGKIVGIDADFDKKSLIVGTEDGHILFLNLEAHIVLNKIKLNLAPVFKITKFKWTTIEEQPFGIVCYRDQQDNDFVVLVDLLKVSNVQRYQLPLKNDPKFKVKLTSGPSKSDFFVVWQKRSLFIADKNSTQFIQHDIQTPINVVACHPGEDLIATGDIIGRIMLWRNFHQKYPVREELHWHHQIVLSLAFSQSGTMLYSGGVECVLVKWTINNKCIEKEFLPRLAGSVRQISVNPKQDKLAISTDDNAIQIINSNLTQLLSIQDFTIASSYDLGQSDPFPCGIKVDPRNHHLVTNGRLGHLQFFSTKTMKLLFNMDICNRNVIPRQRKLNIFSHQVTHVAFAGKWMATVENWNDRINYPESSLKFWKFLDGQQTYSLHTQIEQPHEKEVNFLEFPQKQLEGLEICVTGGHDKCIRVWSLEKSENVKNPKYIWLCIEQLSYKNLPIYSMSFSQDSTLLAAGFGNILCLYDTFKFQLKAALSTPANFDGSINRVLLTIPPNKKMSSPKKKVQVKSIQERRKALDMMYSMINGPGGNELVKDVTQEKHRFFKQNKMKREKSANMSKHEKQEIFRRVLLNTELTFGQKIQILHQLNIYYKITDRMEEEVIKFISRTICDSRLLYKNLHRNLSQVRNHEKYKVQWRFRTWMLLNSKRNRNIVTVRKLLTQPAKPEVLEKKKQAMEKSGSQLPIKNTTHINNVLFCMGELPHLVLVTTADRLLVWNILTLKLQGSFKLQAKFITLDPLTNLCAVFTQHNEVFVIHPSPAITLHFQKDLPKIYGAIWSPVDLPKVPKDNVNWQSTSHLLFLTHKQEICTFKLPGDEDYNNGLPFVNKTIGSVATPFASMMALKITEDPSIQQQNLMTRRIGITGSGSVREIISFPSHAMPPLRMISEDFTSSLLMVEQKRIEHVKTQEDRDKALADEMEAMKMSGINEEKDLSEDERHKQRKALETQFVRMKDKVALRKASTIQREAQIKNYQLENFDTFDI